MGTAPPSLPAGAEAAVLYGDPAKEGMFALRIKAPKGYRIAPHTHPKPEVITVISGKFSLGLGQTGDRAGVETLPAGSFSLNAARDCPLRFRRRRLGRADQRDRALGH